MLLQLTPPTQLQPLSRAWHQLTPPTPPIIDCHIWRPPVIDHLLNEVVI
uniref:Uncharacterized protein n=1 Tax=Stomoxys calcitrans TaxID=35570 RepID=A0A1I8PRP9_STOCA